MINNSRTLFEFKFDGLLGMDSTQDDVFASVARPVCENVLSGFNGTIFAYGQTGSGKTYTITGGTESFGQRGVIPRTLSHLFRALRDDSRSGTQFQVRISFLEIYNEQGYDLLSPHQDSARGLQDLPKVSLREDEDGNVHMQNLTLHPANSEEEALNLLFLGDTNRAIAETPMNPNSSRSHCVFTVQLEQREAGSDRIRRSKLHLVDLAGSERAHKHGTSGQLLREASYINKSLHYLQMVIVALHERSKRGRGHVPYRNSLMTSVLRDSLGGNCLTSMIATMSPEERQTDESISTCRFAQRVALVRQRAEVNEELDPNLVIKRLKAEVRSLSTVLIRVSV
jgi:kinesin family protein 6/9